MALTCLCCGLEDESVELASSCTQYETPIQTRYERILEVPPEDPNAPIPLCPPCAEDHYANMSQAWNEYYGGLL